jgi:hypothetical protein
VSPRSRTHNQRLRWKVSGPILTKKPKSESLELYGFSGGIYFKARVEVRSRSNLQVDDYQKLKRPETHFFSLILLVAHRGIITDHKSQKINLGFDDSSSVTSMSSTSRSTRCMVCKEEETIVKVLIACIRCKRKIHPGCANPYIEDYKYVFHLNLRAATKSVSSWLTAPPKVLRVLPD